MKTKPLLNNALIEVLRDDDGISRSNKNESMKYGRLIDVAVSGIHLTASSGMEFSDGMYVAASKLYKDLIGKIVRWEEYAEGGQTFEEDGKTYALIPWWRLIGFEEEK